MDAFTYITDFLASASDEDASLPVNEEYPGATLGGNGWCVIAWGVPFLIAFLTTFFLSSSYVVFYAWIKRLANNVLGFSATSQRH